MENTEKTMEEIIAETIKSEMKSFENKFNKLPVVEEETTNEKEVKDSNAEFKEFLVTKAAMTTTSDPVLVPAQYSQTIVGGFGNYGVARRDGFIQSLTSNILNIPRTNTPPSAYWHSEGVVATGSSVVTENVQIPMKALVAKVQISQEMLRTTGYDLLGYVKSEVGRQLAKAEDIQVFTGNSDPFVGIYNDVSSSLYTQSGSGALNPTYTDLVGMEAKLDPTFRDEAKWYFDPTTFAVVKGMKDTTGRPLFENGWADKASTIMGYPFEVVSSGVLNSTSTVASGSKYFVLGNMKNAWIADNGGLEVFIDPYTNASTRNVNYYFTMYEGIGIAQPKSFVVYKIQ